MGQGYNLGYSYLGSEKGNLLYSESLGFRIAEGWGTYIELYGQGLELEFEFWNANIDAELTFAPKNNLQFDISFGRRIDTNWYYVATGVS